MRMWRTRAGNLVPFNHMTDSHIANSVAKIEREQWRMECLVPLRDEQERRRREPATLGEALARLAGEAEESQWREENAL